MAIQSAASAQGRWCAALFLWERRGISFLEGLPYRYQARLAAASVSGAQQRGRKKNERRNAGIKRVETPRWKSRESIQNTGAVKKERWLGTPGKSVEGPVLYSTVGRGSK